MTYDENMLKSIAINLIKIIDSGRSIQDIQKDPMIRVAKRFISNLKVTGNLEKIPEEISLSKEELECLEYFYSPYGECLYSLMDLCVISLRTLDFLVAGTTSQITKWGDGTENIIQTSSAPIKITSKGTSWLAAQRAKEQTTIVALN